MFAPSDFNLTPPRPPLEKARITGLIVLIALFLTCLLFSITADAQIFVPLNTWGPLTRTAEAQGTGIGGTRTPAPRRTTPPRATPTSRFEQRSAHRATSERP
jgi:hypothetical protein